MDDPVITLQRGDDEDLNGFSLDNGGAGKVSSSASSVCSRDSRNSFDKIPILIVNREEAENLRQVHLSKVRESQHVQQVQQV
ncbi:unnamed protein product [Ambrosiozyma monospora]|uniref:Unnamed protein product n=1 Tax=Ambrosiozyma monospora TaxID=43982 RepID=A0ACB5UDH9_AMBMO|nr:unnamed protein product [Ambrosiozyma monospora]